MIRPLLSVSLVLALGACDNLGLGREPEAMTVKLDAQGVDKVTLVTSSDWVFATDPGCDAQSQQCPQVLRILSADTSQVAVPLNRTLRFTNSFKFFVASYPAGGAAATLSMRIDIDGKEWFNETRRLAAVGEDGEPDALQFVYQWKEPRLRP